MNWCDWNREIDRRQDVLEQIVALLFLMAGLADRAAGLSLHCSYHALDALARGEAEARAFVIGLAGASVESDAAIQEFASVGAAERLAASFRVLALVLGAMLAEARRSALAGGRYAALPIAHRWPAGSAPTRLLLPALPAPDTS